METERTNKIDRWQYASLLSALWWALAWLAVPQTALADGKSWMAPIDGIAGENITGIQSDDTPATEWHVGTDVQKKNVLMEEFTGTSCYWCPEGHAVAERMAHVWPGSVQIVNIHTGSLARNYKTAEGDAIGKQFDTENAGYPCGDVNRHDAGDGLLMSRNLWMDAASTQLEEDAPVNLWMEGRYEADTRELTVRVEGYYTGQAEGEQRLNVMLLQDNVWGFQNSSQSGDYRHMHMLRKTLTDVWGDVIDEAEQGHYFEREYKLTLPVRIEDVDVKAEDLKLVAFVTREQTDVQQVTGCHLSGVDVPLGVTLKEPRIYLSSQYGFQFFEVMVENDCTERITNATFELTVGQKTETITCECSIDGYGFAYLSLPMEYNYSMRGTTKYSIRLTAVNGIDMEPQTLSGQFVKPYVTTREVRVVIQSDARAWQNTFTIRNAQGNVVRELGPFADGEPQLVDETIELEGGKTYCLEVSDAWGDGLLSGTEGYYELRNANGVLIEKKNVYGYGQRTFFTTEATEGIETVQNDASRTETRYDLWGRRVVGTSTQGIMVVKKADGAAQKLFF